MAFWMETRGWVTPMGVCFFGDMANVIFDFWGILEKNGGVFVKKSQKRCVFGDFECFLGGSCGNLQRIFASCRPGCGARIAKNRVFRGFWARKRGFVYVDMGWDWILPQDGSFGAFWGILRERGDMRNAYHPFFCGILFPMVVVYIPCYG